MYAWERARERERKEIMQWAVNVCERVLERKNERERERERERWPNNILAKDSDRGGSRAGHVLCHGDKSCLKDFLARPLHLWMRPTSDTYNNLIENFWCCCCTYVTIHHGCQSSLKSRKKLLANVWAQMMLKSWLFLDKINVNVSSISWRIYLQ